MRIRYPIEVLAPVLVGVGFPLALCACGSAGSPPGEAAPSVTSATATPRPGEAAEAPHAIAVLHGHPTMKRLFDVVGGLPMRADQQAEFGKLADDVELRNVATDEAHDALIEAVALQAEQGVIDRSALQPAIDAFTASIADERYANHAALTRFGVILTRPQTSAFLRTLLTGRPAARAVSATEMPMPLRGGLLRGAQLSGEQWRQISLGRRGPETARVTGGWKISPLAHRLALVERIVGILTPDQRSVLGANLRSLKNRSHSYGGPSW
jgi:hypothetical protein